MSFLCNICGYLCDSAQQLAVHENNSHSSKAALCEICGKIIAGKHRLASHRVSHETAECDICHKILKKNSITVHMKKCNGEVNLFQCPTCPYETSHRSDLTRHKKSMRNRKTR